MISFSGVGYEGKKKDENMNWGTHKIFMNYVIITDFYNEDFVAFWKEIKLDIIVSEKIRYFFYGWKW